MKQKFTRNISFCVFIVFFCNFASLALVSLQHTYLLLQHATNADLLQLNKKTKNSWTTYAIYFRIYSFFDFFFNLKTKSSKIKKKVANFLRACFVSNYQAISLCALIHQECIFSAKFNCDKREKIAVAPATCSKQHETFCKVM